MLASDRAVIHSSEEANWRTPPALVEALRREFRFSVDLASDRDACILGSSLGRSLWLGPGSSVSEDALTVDWRWATQSSSLNDAGFLNPPFSKTLLHAYHTGRIKIDGVWQSHEQSVAKAQAYDIANWARKCWEESRRGGTIVGIFPFSPQTGWYRAYVYGHTDDGGWSGHAAMEERRLPHRISFLRPDGSPAGNAGVNSAILIWRPNPGYVGPWQPAVRYWSYR